MNNGDIEVLLSCGAKVSRRLDDFSTDELQSLIGRNPDADPAELAAMEAELKRRTDADKMDARERGTYRGLVVSKAVDTAACSVGGSPFAYELEVALDAFRAKLHDAIDAIPMIAELLDGRPSVDTKVRGADLGVDDGEALPF